MADAPCPNCGEPLESLQLAGLYRELTIDLCAACQGIWFDDSESLQLAPEGTLALFRVIHERHGERRHGLADRLQCPRCGLKLSLVVDQQRDTKFQYYRCARGHGRFITFFHFLRARNFVRSLSPREMAELRARIRQVNCSNCGAPIDLAEQVACGYCRAPVSLLDPEQVRKTLAHLQEAADRRHRVDPELPLELLVQRAQVERLFADAEGGAAGARSWRRGGVVEAGLDALFTWVSGIR